MAKIAVETCSRHTVYIMQYKILWNVYMYLLFISPYRRNSFHIQGIPSSTVGPQTSCPNRGVSLYIPQSL
jgi:hypothetical protein